MLLRRMGRFGLVLACLTSPVAGQNGDLLNSAAYQDGLRALADHLPEQAIRRFESLLSEQAEDRKVPPELHIRLAEAMVRAGRAEKALATLEAYPENHEALRWKAHALVTLGKLRLAETTFALLSQIEDEEQRDDANMARARILASLHDDRELSTLFQTLGESTNPAVVAESQLLHATVLLEKSLHADCSQLLPAIKPVTPGQEAFLSFLKGRHALAGERFATAVDLLQPLTEPTATVSRAVSHSASFSLSRALHLQGKDDQAIEFLLDFLTRNPDNLYLQPCFENLTQWSRENEVLRELVLQRLREWSPDPSAATLLEQGDPSAIALTTVSAPGTPSLLPHALFHRALLLAGENDKKSVARAKFLLARLRLEAPQSTLVPRSLLETSRLHLGEQNREAALAALRTVELVAESAAVRAHAAELAARISFEEADFAKAADAFSRLRKHFEDGENRSAILNEGISLLLAEKNSLFGKLLDSVAAEELLVSLPLERTLIRASNLEKSARTELKAFLDHHGDHPRTPEAQVALAELLVFLEPHDLTMAQAHLELVEPIRLPDTLALRHLLTYLRLAELTGEWEAAIACANGYLTSRPEAMLKPAVRLKLGQAFYLNNDSSKAQLVLQQVANDSEATEYHEVALFFAARAAIKVTTPEARQEAITLFKRVLEIDGPLANDARIQLARTHLDAGEPDEAIAMLAPLITNDDPKSSPLDALLLQAEALRAQGSEESDNAALAIYGACLSRKDLRYADSNRIHYLEALTLDQLGRRDDALDTLYKVVNRENLPDGAPITEWRFFYDCGNKAISLLEKEENWAGALAIARKLARAGGPKSAEATERARAIQLEHMILEE